MFKALGFGLAKAREFIERQFRRGIPSDQAPQEGIRMNRAMRRAWRRGNFKSRIAGPIGRAGSKLWRKHHRDGDARGRMTMNTAGMRGY